MTRKHFEAIAADFHDTFESNANLHRQGAITIGEKVERDLALLAAIRRLAASFRGFNPNFDESRFRAACGG